MIKLTNNEKRLIREAVEIGIEQHIFLQVETILANRMIGGDGK